MARRRYSKRKRVGGDIYWTRYRAADAALSTPQSRIDVFNYLLFYC
jgi:hypothetical protein